MKKFINACLFLCLALGLGAQTYPVSIEGGITYTNGDPAQGVGVMISFSPDPATGFGYFNIVYSDTDGHYAENVAVPSSIESGQVAVSIAGCDSNLVTQVFDYSVNAINNFTADFVACENPFDSCAVDINWDSTGFFITLAADATGEAPFTYLWSTGETTPTIEISTWNVDYCVTVTDATGCVTSDCIYGWPACWASIFENPAGGLTASAQGNAPFSYLWNNGETTETIFPNAPGSYCVTVTDAENCQSLSCYWYNGGANWCEVYIYDSLGAQNGVIDLFASAMGTGPFTYQWDYQNAQTPYIEVPAMGEYCVTITSSTGCTASNCIDVDSMGCSVYIYNNTESLTANQWGLGGFTYLWDTGETTATISPTETGTYCVTMTAVNGCESTACASFDPFADQYINGYVILEDSTLFTPWSGIVELYQLDGNGDPIFVESTPVTFNPNSWGAYYDFGIVDEGEYIIKAIIDPNDPLAATYLPTYYGDVLLWDEAMTVNIPGWGGYYITMQDGINLTGDGTIDGLITEGDGLKGDDDDRNPGDPLAGVSILHFNNLDEPIMATYTGLDGTYSFGNLPFGTYKVVVEIVGLEQGIRWVTLSSAAPNASGINFDVTEAGIVNGIAELVNEQGFSVSPNPASDFATLRVNASASFEARLSLTSTTGAVIFAQQTNIAAGDQRIEVNLGHLPTGVYFLQLTTGREVLSRKVVKQ